MSSSGRCTTCGTRIPRGAPGGLCPACLMAHGLEEATRAEIPPPGAGGPPIEGADSVSSGSSAGAGMHANSVIQEFGCKISSIAPGHGAELRMYGEILENFEVAQRFEDLSVELSRKIDLSLEAIAEFQPENIVSSVTCLNDLDHLTHSEDWHGGILP